MAMKVVKLSKHYKNLMPGEVAGFSEEEAAHIVANKGGEYVAVEEKKEAAAAPAPKK